MEKPGASVWRIEALGSYCVHSPGNFATLAAIRRASPTPVCWRCSMQAGYSQGIHRQNRRSCFCPQERAGLGNDSTHYLHSCRRHHNRAVTGLWLTSLHDGKRGTCQVFQGASCLGRHQPLLDIRNGTRAFETLTSCGGARAFATTRKRGSACAFPTTRNRGTAFLPTRNR